MAKTMKTTTIISAVALVSFAILNTVFCKGWLLSLAITFATITYHFSMRLCVGYAFDKVMDNKADYTCRWYKVSEAEFRLYKFLRVKKWKAHMPTYDPELFSPKIHTWEEIIQAIGQAELVHETIVVLSFLPIFMSKWVGAFYVFLITSIVAALIDLSFVILQRYNRPRVLKIIRKRV